ncbi:MAG: 2Fe-2S iron-sulfur cluster binding domain-containing protein [bacterium]|nr:2Fe-2S iron-sulfur cluster binding domain-containing protein [bacterium]
MLSFFGLKNGPKQVQIEGVDAAIVSDGKETILTAALKAGIRYPNNCRVGGCGACKCQLKSGKVKELTESAYILTAEELKAGYILACQSIPKTDVVVHVDHIDAGAPSHPLVTTGGTITARRALTHDIVELTVTLDEPLRYSAGQFAAVSVPGVVEQARSYSFARAPSANGNTEVVFYVRAVPNGVMSNWVQGDAALNHRVVVEGPYGEFYLRESGSQIYAIAGGSGLAPVRALLEQALNDKCNRPVVFVFGARTQKDLYCLDDFASLRAKWNADFTFIPVLSHEPEDSDWKGERGLVTQFIEKRIDPQAQVYMCGPPPMIDAAIAELERFSFRANDIFFDKFLDQSHTAAPEKKAG